MPVLWRHHVPLALSMFCIYNLTMLGPLVDVFVCSPAAVQHTAALYTALEASAYTLSGLLMPYPMQRPTAASPRAQVYILVLWLQLHLALLVPSLYLYRAESRCVCGFRNAYMHCCGYELLRLRGAGCAGVVMSIVSSWPLF
jgi:hypothetical protein